jgi:hypothetical protein
MIGEDNRDWPEYNEQLVRRGWFYLCTDFVENWDKELEKMNKHTNGHPYRYPETFIQFSGLSLYFSAFALSPSGMISQGIERLCTRFEIS